MDPLVEDQEYEGELDQLTELLNCRMMMAAAMIVVDKFGDSAK